MEPGRVAGGSGAAVSRQPDHGAERRCAAYCSLASTQRRAVAHFLCMREFKIFSAPQRRRDQGAGMWTLSRHPAALTALALFAGPALAQTPVDQNNIAPIIAPSQSSVYNQNTVNLPTPPSVFGQDSIRGADGVTCQSAIASGGPYVDMGVIGAQDVFSRNTAAVYGRVVVPIGKRGKRLDCTKLYKLELARMQAEIDLLRNGAPGADYVATDAAPPPFLSQNMDQQLPLSSPLQSAQSARASLAMPPRDILVPPPARAREGKGVVEPEPAASVAPAYDYEDLVDDIFNKRKPTPAAVFETTKNQQAPPNDRPFASSFFAQLGEFPSKTSALAYLKSTQIMETPEGADFVAARGVEVLSLARRGRIRHRLRIGPATRIEAASLCALTTGACLVVAGGS